MTAPRYPIGAFTSVGRTLQKDERAARIVTIADGPRDSWCTPSPTRTLNAYVRFRLALTEDHPTIRPYHGLL